MIVVDTNQAAQFTNKKSANKSTAIQTTEAVVGCCCLCGCTTANCEVRFARD
jgi:hypothetical protein